MDLTKSRVPDPKSIPVDSASRKLPQTMWRVDRLRDMTYTQFWHLIQERQIARVSNCLLHVKSGRTASCDAFVLHSCVSATTHLHWRESCLQCHAIGKLLLEELFAFCLIPLSSASCTCCLCTAALNPLRQGRSQELHAAACDVGQVHR